MTTATATPRRRRASKEERLATLAATANEEHALATGAMKTSREHAIKAGKALLAAKKRVKGDKGKWEPWVDENCSFSPRTARVYMQLAENRQSSADSEESIAGALRSLSAAKPNRPGAAFHRPKATLHPEEFAMKLEGALSAMLLNDPTSVGLNRVIADRDQFNPVTLERMAGILDELAKRAHEYARDLREERQRLDAADDLQGDRPAPDANLGADLKAVVVEGQARRKVEAKS